MMGNAHRCALCWTLLVMSQGCSPSGPPRTVQVACGSTMDTVAADSGRVLIGLDTAAARTVHRIELAVFPMPDFLALDIAADDAGAGCAFNGQRINLTLTGTWEDPPAVAVRGRRYLRFTVQTPSALVLDTLLDLRGPAHQRLQWAP